MPPVRWECVNFSGQEGRQIVLPQDGIDIVDIKNTIIDSYDEGDIPRIPDMERGHAVERERFIRLDFIKSCRKTDPENRVPAGGVLLFRDQFVPIPFGQVCGEEDILLLNALFPEFHPHVIRKGTLAVNQQIGIASQVLRQAIRLQADQLGCQPDSRQFVCFFAHCLTSYR